MVQGWELNISRDTRHYVQPGNITALISASNLCPSGSPILLLVIVCSAPSNTDQRIAIRETWASQADSNVRVAFLVGESDNATIQQRIEEESIIYTDMIQEGFLDTYNNLTVKSVMMLKWVEHYCSLAQFLMKADDDMFVNLPALVDILKPAIWRKNILIGSLICRAKPILDAGNKWYTPQYMFGEQVYPNYLSGTGYVMSRDVVSKLYKAALVTPIIHLEDVYITGVCARAARVKPRNHSGFTYQRRKLSDSCNPCMITNHRLTSEDLHTAFSYMYNCSTSSKASDELVTQPSKSRNFARSSQCH